MSKIETRSDWDTFEELHIFTEQIEIAQRLLKSRSHSKWRAAVIILDHVADALIYRVAEDDFSGQEFMELVIPPEFSAEKRERILSRFDEKLAYIRKKNILSEADISVLSIAHQIRNLAYHRNFHNTETVDVVGKILYKTMCAIIPVLLKRGQRSYSSSSHGQPWFKKYGVSPAVLNFEEVADAVANGLSKELKLTVPGAAKALRVNLSARYRSMSRTMKRWLRLRTDRRLNEMLRHYEFADVRKEDLVEMLRPVKEARYALHNLYKGHPPEEWQHLIEKGDADGQIGRRMVSEEEKFKKGRQQLFDQFRQSITAKGLRGLGKDIAALQAEKTFSSLLSKYESIEQRLTRFESYVVRAEQDLDLAIDVARGK